MCNYQVTYHGELIHCGIISPTFNEMSLCSVGKDECKNYATECVDDMSGKPLRSDLVQVARSEAMAKFGQHEA